MVMLLFSKLNMTHDWLPESNAKSSIWTHTGCGLPTSLFEG